MKRENQYRIEFTPQVVGPHVLTLAYGGQEVAGTPYVCNVYDASKVKVKDVSQSGIFGQLMGFTGVGICYEFICSERKQINRTNCNSHNFQSSIW